MKKNISVTFVLWTPHKTKDNNYNLKVRVYFNGVQRNYPTVHYFTKEQWAEIKGRAPRKLYTARELEEVKHTLLLEINEFKEIIDGITVWICCNCLIGV